MTPSDVSSRRYPVGAEPDHAGVSFRVWAPAHQSVDLQLDDNRSFPMRKDRYGYFSVHVAGARAGLRYRYKLSGCDVSLPDPASRFQPDGPSGASEVIDPMQYAWKDHNWTGIDPTGQVIYEMHMGTFTPEGTWQAAIGKLGFLRELGITCIEVMPINEFNGTFGWGYDGTHPYAPTRLYGRPDDVRAFVDEAHAHGVGVILDVVYNHFGVGDRFRDFSPDYFTDRYWNEWGNSINFDGPGSDAVREFFSKNAACWIDEFHFDGLRLDATQALYDSGPEHVMALIGKEARAAAKGRSILLVAENEPQDTRLVRPIDKAGYGLDALWNDDFHHSAMVALTARNEAYYHDHRGQAQEFVSSAKYGYLFQGQRYDWQNAGRGRPGLDLQPLNFVHFLQNHDQVANSGTGARLNALASPAKVRALTALLLLGPQTPMLFQGQEFGASTPFHYFADQQGDLVELIRKGRVEFMAQFPSLKDNHFCEVMPLPGSRQTFLRSKLDWRECDRNVSAIALHRDLLALRRNHRAFSPRNVEERMVDGSCLSSSAFLLRFVADRADDERLLVVNLGSDLHIRSVPDPLIAPPDGLQWDLIWSSEDFRYGGSGVRTVDLENRFTLPGEAALVFTPIRRPARPRPDRANMKAWQENISAAGATLHNGSIGNAVVP